MIFDQQLDSDLWIGERSVCMFIHDSKCYWVIDYREHFCIDAEIDYQGYLDKGHISHDQFVAACEEFRGGILKLSTENFLDYLALESSCLVSCEAMHDYLCSSLSTTERARIYGQVEDYLVYGTELSSSDFEAANRLVSKLPLFYINFDRKIYMHMDWDRCHESLALDDWSAKGGDFSCFIPASEIYWDIGGFNFWKLKTLCSPF